MESIETVREFWDSQPCNVKHSSEQLGSRTYFEEVTKKRYTAEPHVPDFAGFSEWNGKKVLEIGCGIGTDGAEFAKAGATYVGVDLSEASVELAKRRFKIEQLNGEILVANAENLQEELDNHGISGPFDLIYSFGVLHHTPDLMASLHSLKKLCGDNTTVRAMVYAENSWKNSLIKSGLDQPEAKKGVPIANTYQRDEIVEAFAQAGLSVNRIWQDHIFQWQLTEYKKGKFVRLPWFEAMTEEMFSALRRDFGWHLLIEARADRT